MKYYSLTLAILLLLAQLAVGQTNPPVSKMIYKISILDSSVNKTKGYLFNITDTTVKISDRPVRFANATARENFREVNYNQINEITLKRSKAAGRGAWKGAVIGALIGVAAGFIEGDDPEIDDPFDPDYYINNLKATEKAVIYGALGGAVGTGIGALVGALVKKKFIIGGNKEQFDAMKANVLTKAYGKNGQR
jgi:hypothetical protein